MLFAEVERVTETFELNLKFPTGNTTQGCATLEATACRNGGALSVTPSPLPPKATMLAQEPKRSALRLAISAVLIAIFEVLVATCPARLFRGAAGNGQPSTNGGAVLFGFGVGHAAKAAPLMASRHRVPKIKPFIYTPAARG
jgi:hypothetical protein